MGLNFSKRGKGQSKREYAAQMLGGSKEDYNSDGSRKSSGGSSKSSSSSKSSGPSQKTIDKAAKEAYKAPEKTSEQLFQELWSTKGMDALKGQVTAVDAEIASAKGDLTKALGVVDENPWLSESSRVGKGNRLNNLAAGTINNLIAKRAGVTDTYNNTLTEINGAVGRNNADFVTGQGLAQGYLTFLTGQQTVAQNAVQSTTKAATTAAKTPAASSAGGKGTKYNTGTYVEGVGWKGSGAGYVGGVWHGVKSPDGNYYDPNSDMGYIASPEYQNKVNGW